MNTPVPNSVRTLPIGTNPAYRYEPCLAEDGGPITQVTQRLYIPVEKAQISTKTAGLPKKLANLYHIHSPYSSELRNFRPVYQGFHKKTPTLS